MKATVQNYLQIRNTFNTKNVDENILSVFKELDDDFEDYIDLYTDPSSEFDQIREVVDNHIKLVNKYFLNDDEPKKPAGEIIVAKVPKYDFVEPKKKEVAKKETIEDAFLNAKHTRSIMPKMQMMAVLESGKGEEKQFFINKIKEFEKTFEDAKKRQNLSINDQIVKAHFFYGETDWYILDYDPSENMFFGYVILNGDVQNAEAGYISIPELHTIKGIELDFYWTKKELGKVLHSRYPDEYPVYEPKSTVIEKVEQNKNVNSKDLYIVKDGKVLTNHGMKEYWFTDNPQFAHQIEDIAFANRMKKNYNAEIVMGFEAMKNEIENYSKKPKKSKSKTKTQAPKKTKIAKVVDTKQLVDNNSPEFLLIRRFYNMIKKGETSVIPFNTVRLLYAAFNKAAVERKVRKTSEHATLFNKCNEKLTILFEKFANPKKADVTIEFTDKKLLAEIEEFSTNKKVMPSVSLLKSFIAIQGTLPDVTTAKNLLNKIKKNLETNNDRLKSELMKAKTELESYLKKPSEKIEPTQYGLSRPRSVCTNRVKCTGIDKTGKLHKGYKFQEGTGHVVKVRKSKLGSPKCVNRVKCTGLTKSGKLMKGYKFEEGTGNVVRVSRKKKSSTKKKGLGVVQVIEHTPIQEIYHNPIVPIVKENTNQLGYTPNPTPMVDNVENNAYENEEAKNPPFEQKPVVKNKLMSMTFDYLEMDEGWEYLMQNPARNMRIAIWGPPKNGKTAAALQMADYLSKFGKVLYNFADQGFNKSTQDLWISSGLAENGNCEPNDASTLQALEKEINTGKYDFVFIDMISDYIRTEKIKPEDFKENFIRKYPNISFILIFEVTKDGNFKGDQGWTHLVDATMTVKDFLIENRGRYGMGEKVIWEEGLRKFNPKKYDEIYLSKPIQEI